MSSQQIEAYLKFITRLHIYEHPHWINYWKCVMDPTVCCAALADGFRLSQLPVFNQQIVHSKSLRQIGIGLAAATFKHTYSKNDCTPGNYSQSGICRMY